MSILPIVSGFVFHYPLFMAFAWMMGALLYRLGRAPRDLKDTPQLAEYPKVSVLIPCHNEAACIEDVIGRMAALDYPDYELLAIDDGSTDRTPELLDALAAQHERLRVVTLTQNQGKATALRMGALVSNAEYLVCIDADSFVEKDALHWIVWHFVNFPRVGAVTGNPRIRNRTTLLSKIQVGEYSTIIGLIKRTQRIIGKVFTISGVVAAFRKRAIIDVGMWSDDMATEDIDISWKLQTRFWDIRFEEHALCWLLTPETIGGLWKQRVRWAQGGAEVVLRYPGTLLNWKQRRIWPVYLEYLVSVIWSYAFVAVALLALLNLVVELPAPLAGARIVPEWTGTLLAVVCMIQAAVALAFEHRFERGLLRYLFWFIWYPLAYWVISAAATVVGLPKALRRRAGRKAVWDSPDRGLR